MSANLINKPYNENGINNLQNILDMVYPVGSIYMSTASISPGQLFGFGEWEQIKDKFLLAAGERHTIASTGGEETHVLTTSELPSHTHTGSTDSSGAHTHSRGTQDISGQLSGTRPDGAYISGAFYQESLAPQYGSGSDNVRVNTQKFVASRNWSGATSSNGAHTHIITNNNTGGGTAHNNMPPYLAVNVWKRVA